MRGERESSTKASVRRTLAGVGLFADLDEGARQALERRCAWRSWHPGEQIIDREGESTDVYFVVCGRAQVMDYSENGQRAVIFDEIGPGGCFGELSAIDGEPRSAHIVAGCETVTASLGSEAFIDALFQHRAVGAAFLRRLTEMVRQSTARIMDVSVVAANNRIYAELLRRAKLGPGMAPNTAVIRPIPVHGEMAARVSTSRETVARAMSELAHRGMLQREHDALVITDLSQLTSLAAKHRDGL
ncbi:MAG: Crp/Fnr family transcriptional regulator [Alphaproteobacteria bacterium]|nr:Crp/Fnr family transcriptional regulator [Alphaproteobacteria bacterium]